MNTLARLFSLLILSTAIAHAGVKQLHRTDGDHLISPDGALLAVSDITGLKVYDTDTLATRFLIPKNASLYSFNENATRLYYKVFEEALFELNLENGEINRMIPHPNVMDVFLNTEKPDLITFTTYDDNYRPSLFKYQRSSSHAPEKLVAIEPIKGVQFRNDQFIFDPRNETLLHYAIEVSKPVDAFGERKELMTRFVQIDHQTGQTKLLSEVNLQHYPFRWSQVAAGKIEVDAGGTYLLVDPYTGEEKLNINIPGISFGLDATPGVVYAKRTEQTDGVDTNFYDIVQSGSLKTIHNFQLPKEWEVSSFSPITAYDTATQTQWFNQESDLIQIDFTTGKVVARYPLPLKNAAMITANNENIHFLENTGWDEPRELYQLDRANSELTQINPLARRDPMPFRSLSFHPTKLEFFATDAESKVHFFQINRTGLKHQFRGLGVSNVQYSNDGEQMAYTEEYGEFSALKPADNFPKGSEVSYEGSQAMSMQPIYCGPFTFSNSGKWLISCDTEGAFLHTSGEPAIAAEIDNTYGEFPHMQFSPDDTQIAHLGMENIWSEADQGRKMVRSLRLFKVDPTQEFLEVSTALVLPHENFAFLGFSQSGQFVRLLDTQDGKLRSYDTKDFTKAPKELTRLNLPEFTSIRTLYDTPNNLCAVAVGTTIYVLKMEKSAVNIMEFQSSEPVTALHLMGNSRHLIAQTSIGGLDIIDLHNPQTQRPIATLNFYNGAEDYILKAANGQFDASSNMQRVGYIVDHSRPLQLSQIFERSYEPNLLERVFAGVEITSEALEAFVIAPKTSITGKQINALKYSLHLYAEQMQHPLDMLSLYQNGKLVKTFKASAPDRLLIEDFQVDLLLEPNEFTLIATDTTGTTSSAAIFSVNPPQAAVEAAKRKQDASRLHILAVGINEYQNPEYNLNFAVADAESVLKQLLQSNQALFDTIETTKLTNDQATHDGLLDAFAKITKDANPQDVFIFYFAGHGVMSQEDQNFYLVPTDVTKIYGQSDTLIAHGISSQKLRALSESIRAQKQLFVLDACNSAGALQAFTNRGASEEKAIAQLARSTGTHWIAASSSNQFATEFATLGHGAFTYTLLKAFSGDADTGDKRITINELKAYLESELPNVTKEYKGSPQYPASYGYGQDFPIALIP